ncbi:SDR family oxidoreductase, partial [Microbacterium binotii]|uniref:SDR family oxidoreductase n=1 Tax=Microbacterium binotii TaxID=462710 RepID=UPI0031D4678D
NGAISSHCASVSNSVRDTHRAFQRPAQTFGRHALGAITATEVFLDQLKAAPYADIVNISSVAGRTARAGNGGYAATKWAINGWSESLRLELLPQTRVTVIEPGAVATELPQHITHAGTKDAVTAAYDQVQVTAKDIAEVIAFAVTRPQHFVLNEILMRPATQA